MDFNDLETRVRNIDERTTRIEQILPTLATKDDLRQYATKDDLQRFATKDDLAATREELYAAISAEGELTRACEGLRQFSEHGADALADQATKAIAIRRIAAPQA